MDLKEAVAMLKQEKLSRARPWSAISDDYLTAREFLSLIGIPGKGRDYRRTIRWLSIASSDRSDKNLHMPEYLKKCFREAVVCAHLFRGTAKGAVTFEYRIPLESLDPDYVRRAKSLVAARKSNSPYSVPLSRRVFMELTFLSAGTGKSMPEMIEEWAHREIHIVLAKPQDPGPTP